MLLTVLFWNRFMLTTKYVINGVGSMSFFAAGLLFSTCTFTTYRHARANWDWPKNMLLIKNPHFLRNNYENWSKWGTHDSLILTKFPNDCVKIVDFWVSINLALHVCMLSVIICVIYIESYYNQYNFIFI